MMGKKRRLGGGERGGVKWRERGTEEIQDEQGKQREKGITLKIQ